MDKNTKILLGIVTVMIVLGGLIWVVFSNNSGGLNSGDTSSSDYLKSIQPITTSAPGAATTTPGTPRVGDAEKNTPLYVDMVVKFGGNRLQFDNDCTSVSPTGFVVKVGKQFMIDNRDTKSHVFSFAGQTYKVSDLGYAVVTTTKVGNWPLLCDGAQRVKVNVEK